MGKGDKKSEQGKRWRGSYGNSRNRKKIKTRLKREANKKHSAVSTEKPKTKKPTKKKED
ncbi:MAG: 30S ribosomal protein THX [Bacteroidetes bacterium]|nr:30S ribosomal protein THX [Bacteroidota bacterium]